MLRDLVVSKTNKLELRHILQKKHYVPFQFLASILCGSLKTITN
jgi:hypothetical protein